MQLLRFLKQRKPNLVAKGSEHALPVAEEKQILDAIKIVLENGYCIGDYEIIQILDLIGLRGVFAKHKMTKHQNNQSDDDSLRA